MSRGRREVVAGRRWREDVRLDCFAHAAEVAKLNELLPAGAIDQQTYTRSRVCRDRALRSSQAWTDSAARFLKDYVAQSNDAATATEQA